MSARQSVTPSVGQIGNDMYTYFGMRVIRTLTFAVAHANKPNPFREDDHMTPTITISTICNAETVTYNS